MGHGGVDLGNQGLQDVLERSKTEADISRLIENIESLYGENQAETYKETINEVRY